MSTPSLSPGASPGSEDGVPDVTVRPMRLKVLYTFDDQNKTNCLARWPNVINVRTVEMSGTIIGVIELKTCIQAIVSASPELVANLGHDFTVYAYDYSEYETPLVGQGMLSWALASASPTPSAPAHQSRQLITGRVCSSLLGLFTNGINETLEVKLRLVPVPTSLQSEYLSSMEKYREISQHIPEGFDHESWMNFLKANPNFGQIANRLGASTPSTVGDQRIDQLRQGAGMEVIEHMLSQGLLPNESNDFATSQEQGSILNGSHLGPSAFQGNDSRAASPAPSFTAGMELQRITNSRSSRPDSRASVRSNTSKRGSKRSKSPIERPSSAEYMELTTGAGQEEGPAKKRARVTKTNWHGKAALLAPESLRVAASTAASMRIFRPIAMTPGDTARDSGEAPPRAPTPRPDLNRASRPRTHSSARSGLTREVLESDGFVSRPGSQNSSLIRRSIETGIDSPDEIMGSSNNLPTYFPSSPPVMMHDVSPGPSSPAFPTMPNDSGFMSGTIDELFGDNDEDPTGFSIDNDPIHVASTYGKQRKDTASIAEPTMDPFTILEEVPGPPELLPKRMPPRPPSRALTAKRISLPLSDTISPQDYQHIQPRVNGTPQRSSFFAKEAAAIHSLPPAPEAIRLQPASGANNNYAQVPAFSQQPHPVDPPLPPPTSSRDSRPSLERTHSIGSLKFPPMPASDPIRPGPSSLQRAQSWSVTQHPMSDAPMDRTYRINPHTTNYQPENAQTGAAKKKFAIQSNLREAVANGSIPPYCGNCGAIETPAWRKAWAKNVEGTPADFTISAEEGGIVAIHNLGIEDGIAKVRIVKHRLLPDDSEWMQILLCNPCGIWLNKYKRMRPQEKWDKDRDRDHPKELKSRERRQRARASSKKSNKGDVTESDTGQGQDDQPSPSDAADTPKDDETTEPQRQRAASVEPCKSATKTTNSLGKEVAAAALVRAIQSSPAGMRVKGSSEQPINVDDLGPTRRVLFPSPRKSGEFKSLDPQAPLQPRCSNRRPTSCDNSPSKNTFTASNSSPIETGSVDKENRPPPNASFEDVDFSNFLSVSPRTPSRRRTGSVVTPFRTPSRLTPSQRSGLSSLFSSAAKAGLLPVRTPDRRIETSTPSRSIGALSPFGEQLRRYIQDNGISDDEPFRFEDFAMDFSGHLPLDNDIALEDVFTGGGPESFFELYEDPPGAWDGIDLANEEERFTAEVTNGDE